MSTSQEHGVGPGRRTVVTAVGAASVAAVLAACAGKEEPEAEVEAATGSTKAAGSTTAMDSTEDVLAKTADIPQGGGKVFAGRGVVVTQPKPGEFKAFSSKCTHQGCAVSSVSDGAIHCPCHGSRFDVATGDATAGPATQPLPARPIKVANGSITLSS
ncbi:Rieske (2Fe-2S) protein [Streptomyces sp. NPDC052042]|uniref:Rieske (2Fe-2S) protein n=1 Tax=Streptomyces sp. NPDC052042 TaxID=3365683 RepID=UPI0037D5FBF0